MEDSALASAESWLSVIGWVKLAAALLVTIGVALEFGGDWVSRPHEKIVKEARERQLAQLRSDTARLSAEAEAARRETAEVNLATAMAGRENAIASQQIAVTTERIALAQGFITPEMLTEGARPFGIIPKISPFRGKRFDIVVTSKDIPLRVLLNSLKQSLQSAGWIEVDRNDNVSGGQPSGVGNGNSGLIKVFTTSDPELLSAGEALTSALNEVGIAATLNPDNETVDNDSVRDVIHILVSPKPIEPPHDTDTSPAP